MLRLALKAAHTCLHHSWMASSRACPTGIANTVSAVMSPRLVGQTTLGHEHFDFPMTLWEALDLGSRESLFDVKIQSGQREDDAYWGRVDGRRSLSIWASTTCWSMKFFRPIVHVEFVVGVHRDGNLRQVGWHEPDHLDTSRRGQRGAIECADWS